LAQEETGIPQEYLDSLIGHESGGDRFAKASTSSATGPAQFIDGTWLRMMRQYGGENGLPATASDQDVLGLRTNPSWASLMASRYTLENQTAMEGALHRPITEGEAYLGHFLGSGDATRLLKAPRGADARGFVSSSAASANPRIFYKPGGGPRTVQEVIDLQTQRFRGQMLPRQRPAGR
jgi:hypothetical protein